MTPQLAIAQTAELTSCTVTAPSGASLAEARGLFASDCPGFTRRDCDPVADTWQCSTEVLNGRAPVVHTKTSTGSEETGLCYSPLADTAAAAKQAFQTLCEGFVRRDCDLMSSGWLCSSGIIGNTAPSVSGWIESTLASVQGAENDQGTNVDLTEPVTPSENSEDAQGTEISAASAGVAPPPVPNGNIIFSADYEGSSLSSGVDGIGVSTAPASDANTLSSAVSRTGQQSINHRVKLNQDYQSAGAWRSESHTISMLPSRYDQGDRIRYEFSIYLANTWEIDTPDSIDIIWQWKRFSSRPDMFVLVRGNDIELRALSSYRATILEDYRIGVWIDLRFDVFHSASDDGSVDMYYKYADQRDYTLAAEYSGPSMLASGPPDSTYLKWGLYKPGYNNSLHPDGERSIFHDAIRVENLQ